MNFTVLSECVRDVSPAGSFIAVYILHEGLFFYIVRLVNSGTLPT